MEISVGGTYRVSLDVLKGFPWDRYVRFAFLFGSATSGGSAGDLDIAISDVGLEALGELLAELAKRLSLPEDYIDLLIVNERTPCPLVLEALRGVPLYVADWDEVYRYFNICQDQQIDSRKLALLETALESIWRG
ncbi:MAG: nucleotidyltransferase domain-containing protein [Thermoproteus sp.]